MDNWNINCEAASEFSDIYLFLFSGGAELLFDKVKKHQVQLPKEENPCKNTRF